MDAGGVLPGGQQYNSLPTTLMKAYFRIRRMEERWEDLLATTTVLANLTENWNIVRDAKNFRDPVIIVQMEQVPGKMVRVPSPEMLRILTRWLLRSCVT